MYSIFVTAHMWTGVHTFHESLSQPTVRSNDGAIVKNRFTTADKTRER
jgi:hypothetical protein